MEYGVGIVMKNIMDNLKMMKETVMDVWGSKNGVMEIMKHSTLVSLRKVINMERDY